MVRSCVCPGICLLYHFLSGMLLGLCFSLAELRQENLTHDLGGGRGEIMSALVILSGTLLVTLACITVH